MSGAYDKSFGWLSLPVVEIKFVKHLLVCYIYVVDSMYLHDTKLENFIETHPKILKKNYVWFSDDHIWLCTIIMAYV